jgi:hypothetical protein
MEQVQLRFPFAPVVAELAKDDASFAAAPVPRPYKERSGQTVAPAAAQDGWTILRTAYAHDLLPVAEQVARRGVEQVLQGAPLARFGELETVDRGTIESLHSIQLIIDEYHLRCGQNERPDQDQKPLCIAVFGAPGSGKSFTINQVAKSLLPDVIQKLEFNLSQMGSADELRTAFHQVRDAGLRGKLPLVFWDEFDSKLDGQDLGWLRHFLVPMQDGYFLEEQVRHPVGKAIFVFAGGIYNSYADFAAALERPDKLAPAQGERAPGVDDGGDAAEQDKKQKKARQLFPMAKGPDFISRLKGHADIQGPNAQVSAEADPHFVIRRAILLRSLLDRAAPLLFHEGGDGDGTKTRELKIDPGVLRAFLQVGRYRHGARSLEAILNISQLANQRSFQRSRLPAQSQLDLHMDGQEFMDLVRSPSLSDDDALVEELARAVHEAYRVALRARGQTNGAFEDWAGLPAELQEQSRAFARSILPKVEQAGFKVVPAADGIPDFSFAARAVEELAQLEHIRWMRPKIRGGWRYGPMRDDAGKLHPGLLPWDEASEEELADIFSPLELAVVGREPLSEEMKQRDRDLVRAIPSMLRRAGFGLVEAHPGQE